MSRSKLWAPIPVYVLQDHRHKSGHLRVLGAILSCPQPYFPSLDEIAVRSGHPRKYCSNLISEMVKFGTLEREQRYNSTNVYKLTSYESTTDVKSESTTLVDTESTTLVDTESTTVMDTESTTVMELKESLKEDINKGNGVLKGFENFCSVYPRHRLGLKRRLHEYWTLNRLEKSSKVIVNSVKEHADTPEWKEKNGMFVPGAQKFLEEERWVVYTAPELTQYEED